MAQFFRTGPSQPLGDRPQWRRNPVVQVHSAYVSFAHIFVESRNRHFQGKGFPPITAPIGSKANKSQFDCYDDLAEDEPYFVNRADDPLSDVLIECTLASA
ncbi:hypothetical protein [Hyphococcus sp.]|uniref:hypothetical protein n=1 Tax=Hyphococcus sp. TaxID=2038636 RepID=UPI003CCBFB4B